MKLEELHIAVVGGAVGGATAALLLARAGAQVTLLEQVSSPRAVGAGIALAANGLAVLGSAGVGGAISAHARSVDAARICDAFGRTLLEPAPPRPKLAMLRRSTLQDVLLDAVASESRISARFGAEVVAADAAGVVEVREGGHSTTIKADLVVGADGVHSRVRDWGDFGARVSPPGITYVRGLAPAGLARTEEAWTPAGLFGSFPVDGATYFFASAGSPACREAASERDLGAFRRAWSEAYAPAGPILETLESWDKLIVNDVRRVDCARWYDGRLALMGDAAHAMAPNLGQGANSALVDAAVLLDALRQAGTLAEALATYEARRRPAVRRVADLSARLGALAEVTHPVLRWARDRLLLPVANRLANARDYPIILQESPEQLVAMCALGNKTYGDGQDMTLRTSVLQEP